jgi:phytoene dehydrogenase-like protein
VTGHGKADFDVVVVGAGHNGLVAAAYLARTGLAVLLLEARETVGGTASTETFAGAKVNICNCDHLAFRTTGIAEELDLDSHGLRYIDIDPPQINGDWTSGRMWEMHHDLEATLDALDRVHPSQVRNYRRYAETMVPLARLVVAAAAGRPRRGRLIARALAAGPSVTASMLRMSRLSASEVMRAFFDDDAVPAAAMVEGPVVWGVSPETPGTGLGALGLALRHVQSVGRPVGGSGALTDALLASFQSAGGLLRTSTAVVSIQCEGRRVDSVRTSDGAVVTARAVLSACDPRRTFVEWLRDPPSRASELVERWRVSTPAEGYESKIDAVLSSAPVLSSLPAGSPLTGLPVASTCVIAPSTAELDVGASMLSRGAFMPRMALLANVPTVADPSLAPPGRHILSLEALYTPYSPAHGWTRAEPERWLEQFARWTHPGLLDSILDWRVLTPPDYERDFHLPRGHATSFSGGPLAAFLGRDRSLTRYETPVQGLWITGAATFPGAGVWGASGRNAAASIADSLSRSGVAHRAGA